MKYLSILTLSILCLHLKAQENDFVKMLGGQEMLIKKFIDLEDHPHIKSIDIKDVSRENMSFDHFKRVTALCGDILVPLNRHQKAKEYHVEVTIKFKRTVPGMSNMCATSQPKNSKCRNVDQSKRDTCLREKLKCLKPKIAKIKVISDLYQDQCSQTIRAFAAMPYTIPGEKIYDTVTLGHTLIAVEQFKSGTLYDDGDTYPVDSNRFFFFGQ